MQKVIVRYLYNSGFTIETEDKFLVIDYYRGPLDLPRDKEVSFFVTHSHEDHYNPQIKTYLDRANFILSYDIEDFPQADNIVRLRPGDRLDFQSMDIRALDSTDLGSSFFIGLEGINIFHSGDLNWWAWYDNSPQYEREMREKFQGEIKKLRDFQLPIDLAFVPVDPRLEKNHYLAGQYFIDQIGPSYFFPMHFGDNYSYNQEFIHRMKDYNTHIIDLEKRNQETILYI